MPSRSFQKDVFKSSERLKRLKSQNNKRYVNGQLVTPGTKNSKVQGAAEILRKKRVFASKPSSEYMNTHEMATSVLQAIGISSLDNTDKNYSFPKGQDNTLGIGEKQWGEVSTIASSNTMRLTAGGSGKNLRFGQLKNKKVSAIKSFKKLENPFYNIDDAGTSRNKYIQQETIRNNKKLINFTNITVALYDENIANRRSLTLGQFK